VLYLGIPFGVGLSPQCGIGVCSGFRTSFISGSIRAYLPFAGKLGWEDLFLRPHSRWH